MNMISRFHLLVAILFFFQFQLIAQENSFAEANKQSKTIAQKTLKDGHISGMSVSVSMKGEMVWSEGFGYADVENKIVPNPAKTQFRIGSISKSLTASGLALIYEEGKVDLDAPIQIYVKSFPEKVHPVTLRQLGGHIAGIRHYRGAEFLSKKKYETIVEGLDIFQNDDLLFTPGEKYSYSSYGWNLISAAMETASEEPFLDFMQSKVFDALGMKNTIADHADQVNPNRTKYYYLAGENEPTEADYVDNSYKWAGGGFLSTSEDLIIFANAMLNDKLVKEETQDLFTTPQKTNDGKSTNYGIGWRSGDDKKSRRWYGHSGGSVGGTSYLVIYPKEEIVVAVVSNMSRAKLNNIAFKIANQYFGQSN